MGHYCSYLLPKQASPSWPGELPKLIATEYRTQTDVSPCTINDFLTRIIAGCSEAALADPAEASEETDPAAAAA